jgi:hypothetical protein
MRACRWTAFCTLLALALFAGESSAQQLTGNDAGLAQAWNISKPIKVCTASIQDFGARCNGNAGVRLFEDEAMPLGPVPVAGWCAAGDDFCGYDIDVWRCASDRRNHPELSHSNHSCSS